MTVNVLHIGETSLQRIIRAVNELARGRSNAVGSVTLTASAASTVVSARNCADGSQPFLTPRTANAAAELAAGGLYVSAVTGGQFTIAHANNSQTDRDFGFVCLG